MISPPQSLASRLQTLTRELDARIILSAKTKQYLPESQTRNVLVRHPQPVQIKGQQTKVDIYMTQ
jgi:class 3 adenylate cyclase